MNVQIEALDLANKLRDMGINVEIEMKDRKLKEVLILLIEKTFHM